MSVSVIIPAFNTEQFISQTLDSVIAQSKVDWEAVVVNDGSTDTTWKIACQYSKIDRRIRVVSQENRGVAESCNEGLLKSDPTRPLALFLHSDDTLEPEALSELSLLLYSNKDAPAAHCESRCVDAAGGALDSGYLPRYVLSHDAKAVKLATGPTTSQTLAIENCIRSPGAVLIRKNALAAVGPWDQAIAGTEDWDMWFRLSRLGGLAYTPRVLFVYRVGRPGSISSHGRMMRNACLRMRCKWLTFDAPARQLTLRGYRANLRLIAKRQWGGLQCAARAGRWHEAIERFPLAAACLAQAMPGVADAILFGNGVRFSRGFK